MSGEDNLGKEVGDFVVESLASSTTGEFFGDKFGSPIEKLFYNAILWCAIISPSFLSFTRREPSTFGEICLKTQETVIDWPIDFVFIVQDEEGVRHFLAVECDGHDFHERTKEQAKRDRSRDRALQDNGYAVYRFTGSEIYRTPLKCARQVWAWAESALTRDS